METVTIPPFSKEDMKEQNRIYQAVDNALYSFSKDGMLQKQVRHTYHLPTGRTIYITDVIVFHEVGYTYINGVWERVVIDEAYIQSQPLYFIKSFNQEAA